VGIKNFTRENLMTLMAVRARTVHRVDSAVALSFRASRDHKFLDKVFRTHFYNSLHSEAPYRRIFRGILQLKRR